MQITIANHLRAVRKAQGYTLITLADASALSRSLLSRAEREETALRVTEVAVLASVLQCAPWDIVSYPGFPCPCCCHWAHGRKESTDDRSFLLRTS